ncbi:MAG: family 43 glycosylhydrolase [Porphyrobacter sp.]|jgi:xylan 1,4-beta-xylosidase|nr:family 43 glycosylhydrolase [Porphyrobacter sp.]
MIGLKGGIPEGQWSADLDDGRFLNPVMAGDYPDPTILKDGDRYYAAFSSFDYVPGLPIWMSRDLVNWTPTATALQQPMGSVYAPELIKHDGRYFIYFPVLNYRIDPQHGVTLTPGKPLTALYVVHAPTIEGPWSDPIDLRIDGAIDPGHAVGEDGRRYLFVNDGRRVRLTDDGLATDGELELVYSGWRYPADWIVESYSLEGPKISERNGWYYMTSAVGGTAGPPTGHMVIVARSRSIHGPWEDCPHNPILRTWDMDEPWWSKGHATLVEGPVGDWWIVYHAIRNGKRSQGRQMLLEPLKWTAEGWPELEPCDLTQPMTKPSGGSVLSHGRALSGPLSPSTLGFTFPMFAPEIDPADRIRFEAEDMIVTASGSSPADCNPLGAIAGDPHYEVTVELKLAGGATGGLILFYSRRAYCGLGSDGSIFLFPTTGPGMIIGGPERALGNHFHLRLVNDRDVVSFYHSTNGANWKLYRSAEVAGLNHNVFNEFLALRPALYAAGSGEVRFRNLTYRAIAV